MTPSVHSVTLRPAAFRRRRFPGTRSLLAAACALWAGLAQGAWTEPPERDTEAIEQRLSGLAPQASPEALAQAARAVACRPDPAPGDEDAAILTVIDFSRPSSAKRLWVFDLRHDKLLFEEWVAHGRNSGGLIAQQFSNRPGSLMSSLGVFRTGTTYQGRNGYSLQLEGLEAGVNDLARDRAIVMHGAPYVSESFLQAQGRLGRSHGCPAVRSEIARSLIDTIKGGTLLFAYAPQASADAARAPCGRR